MQRNGCLSIYAKISDSAIFDTCSTVAQHLSSYWQKNNKMNCCRGTVPLATYREKKTKYKGVLILKTFLGALLPLWLCYMLRSEIRYRKCINLSRVLVPFPFHVLSITHLKSTCIERNGTDIHSWQCLIISQGAWKLTWCHMQTTKDLPDSTSAQLTHNLHCS